MEWREVASFFVSGTPKGQPRPRAFSINGKARVYSCNTAEGWKGAVAMAAREHLPPEPLQGPVRLDATFRFRRPKAHYLRGVLRTNAPEHHTGRPDVDNLHKAVLDCLTQLGMWRDDGQVCAGEVVKVYSEQPGADICILATPDTA